MPLLMRAELVLEQPNLNMSSFIVWLRPRKIRRIRQRKTMSSKELRKNAPLLLRLRPTMSLLDLLAMTSRLLKTELSRSK